MALIVNRCICHILCRSMTYARSCIHFRKYSEKTNNGNNKSESEAVTFDAMDEFTSQLMQRKVYKWSVKTASKLVKEDIVIHKSHSSKLEDLSVDAINVCFQEAISFGDNSFVVELMKQCIKHRKCPSLSYLNYVLRLCSHSGDKDMIVEIKQFCEQEHPEILPQNSNFDHYLAEALWIRGNVGGGLKLFEEVYESNPFLRRRIRLVLKFLITDTISKLGDAVLTNLVRFAERIAKTHNDYFPLICIWETCCLSEWYADQKLAMELLHRNDHLCKAVANRIQYVVSVSLHTHRTEIVYRLLETLLKYDLQEESSGVLLSLFDYQSK